VIKVWQFAIFVSHFQPSGQPRLTHGHGIDLGHSSFARAEMDSDVYRVFHFEVSILAPLLDLGSKLHQILTLARARSIWDFQPLGARARAMPVGFSDALNVKPVC
jgi:hypothetical protein